MPSRHSFREIALIAAATALSGGPHRHRDQTIRDADTAGRPRNAGTAGQRKVRSAFLFLYPPGFGGDPISWTRNPCCDPFDGHKMRSDSILHILWPSLRTKLPPSLEPHILSVPPGTERI